MLDLRFIKLIEKTGVNNKYGKHIGGTAALLHYLRLMECPVNNIASKTIVSGKAFADKFIHAV